MANNTISMVCTGCGQDPLVLGKRYGEGYYTSSPTKLDDWFNQHAWCGDTQDHFEITYELQRDHELNKPRSL